MYSQEEIAPVYSIIKDGGLCKIASSWAVTLFWLQPTTACLAAAVGQQGWELGWPCQVEEQPGRLCCGTGSQYCLTPGNSPKTFNLLKVIKSWEKEIYIFLSVYLVIYFTPLYVFLWKWVYLKKSSGWFIAWIHYPCLMSCVSFRCPPAVQFCSWIICITSLTAGKSWDHYLKFVLPCHHQQIQVLSFLAWRWVRLL